MRLKCPYLSSRILPRNFPHHGASDEGGIHGVFHRICGVEPSRGELGGFVSRMKAGHDIDSAGNVPFSDRTSPPFFRLLPGLILGEECEGSQKKKRNTCIGQSGTVDTRPFAPISSSSSTPLVHPRSPRGQPPDTTTPRPLIPLSEILPLFPRPPPEKGLLIFSICRLVKA